MKDRISAVFWCELIIDTDDCPPNIVSELTGIPYSKLYIKGNPIVYRNGVTHPAKIYQYNLWHHRTKNHIDQNYQHADVALNDIYDLLIRHGEAMQKVLAMFENKHIECNGYVYDCHHYHSYDRELRNKMKMFDIDVEFDFYYFDSADDSTE